MTIAHENTGAVSAQGGSASNPITVVPALGAFDPGDLAVVTVVSRHDTEATPTISWTVDFTFSASGGGGTFGAGTGPARITWFCRVLQSGDTAPTVSLAGTNTGRNLQACITVASRTAGDGWDVEAAFGAEITAGTGWSQACTTNPGIASGDMLLVGYGVRDDQHAGFSAMGITATGATIGAVTERADAVTGLGNDAGLGLGSAAVTAGTASAAPVVTGTIGSSESGEIGVLRLREAVPPVDPQLDGAVVIAETSAAAATTAARDVAADRAVWAFVTHNNNAAATITSAVTDNSGDIAFSLVHRKNTQQGTTAEVWRGWAAVPITGLTVTATGNNGGSGSLNRTHVVLAVFSGEEETAGGDAQSASSASGLPSVALTTTRDGSWVWAVKSDWSAGGTGTPGSGEEIVDSFHSAEYTSDVWRQVGHTATASTSVTTDETAPSAQNYNAVAVEIRQAEEAGSIDLVIDNLSQAQTLEAFAITQDHSLVIANLSQAETLEAFAFTQTHELVIAALSQAQTLDNLTVDSSTNLVIADLSQGQTLDNLVLTQVHQLAVNALTQAQTLDNLSLTQVYQLVIAALTQAQTLGNVTLTQVHQLVIAALTQAQVLDNLVVNSADNLIIANLSQAQTIDGLTLTQIHQLVIDSLTQAQTIDGLTFAQIHQLVIAALTQGQTLDNVALTQLHQLVIANLAQEQTLTNLVVVPGGPAPTLRPTIDIVAVALIRLLSAIPASRVDTSLPKDTAIWSDGFVQAVGVSEQSGMYVPLHVSVINVSCWATNIGSGKPPWGKANQLSEIIKVACLDHSNFPVTLDLSPLGDYGPARVHSAYFITEPHRIPSDEGSYARYDGDLQIYWTPL